MAPRATFRFEARGTQIRRPRFSIGDTDALAIARASA